MGKVKTYDEQVAFFFSAAEKEATAKVAATGVATEIRPSKDGKHYVFWDFWSQYFHEAMNRMTTEAGLRCL